MPTPYFLRCCVFQVPGGICGVLEEIGALKGPRLNFRKPYLSGATLEMSNREPRDRTNHWPWSMPKMHPLKRSHDPHIHAYHNFVCKQSLGGAVPQGTFVAHLIRTGWKPDVGLGCWGSGLKQKVRGSRRTSSSSGGSSGGARGRRAIAAVAILIVPVVLVVVASTDTVVVAVVGRGREEGCRPRTTAFFTGNIHGGRVEAVS